MSDMPIMPQHGGRGFFSRLSPPQVLGFGFLLLIAVGTTLLMLPVAHEPGHTLGFIDALFTATSAVCVTGLMVVDTATTFSAFGEAVILLLIQAGGLGIMTMSALVGLLFGKRISLRERILMQQALGQFTLAGVVRLTRRIIIVTLAIELIGAIILTTRFWFDVEPGRAIWWGVFHAISAFCNAGFDLTSASLRAYTGDWLVVPTVSALIIVGGIGFFVLDDIWTNRRWDKLSVHSRLVLQVSAALTVIPAFIIAFFEWNNPGTLAPHGWSGKILGAMFHAITPRTAGFESVPTGLLTHPTVLLTMILMFIGGSPGSTAGGIKTTTFGVIWLATLRTIRGEQEIVIHGRRLSNEVVDRTWALATIALALVLSVTFVLLLAEPDQSIRTVLFEAVSAFGTVGLSQGVTPDLAPIGKFLITLTMYVGRVGPLTLGFALALQKSGKTHVHYPEDRVMIG